MKITAKPRKYLKYLLLLGLCLCIIGLVAGLVSGSLSAIPLGFLVAGVVIIVLWLGFLGSSPDSFWRRRSTQAGTNALVATLSVLVILGLINFLAVRYATRVDWTENQILTLSPQTKQVVANLQQPLKVWVFDPQANPADRELLENYQEKGSNFQYEFVDPQVKVGLAQEFNVQSLGEVYVQYGSKKQLVQTLNPAESLSEAKLTNTIEQVQRDRIDHVYFLQGHGEPSLEPAEGSLSQAVSALKDRGYAVEPLNLAEQSQVPQDAAAIIIASPQRKLFEGEVKALQNYSNAGGSLLLMLNPNTDSGLEPLLKNWGVYLDNLLAIDASGSGNVIGLGPATPLVTSYGDSPITNDFNNGISFFPLAQPVNVTKEKGIEATPLLITNEQSWAESDLESEELAFDPKSDRSGPLSLGFALDRKQPQSEQEAAKTPEAIRSQKQKISPESRLVVLGNSTFATDGWFEQQLNGDVFLNAVDWLSKEGDRTLSIRPKEPENRRINLTPDQAGIIGWTALLIMPLLGFLGAGLMWWRRR